MSTIIARVCWLSGAVFGFAFGLAVAIALSALAISDDPALSLLDRYAEAYRGGDLDSLMNLFADDAEENGLRGADLRNAYARTLPVEDYQIEVERLEPISEGARVEGAFTVKKGGRQYQGNVRFLIAERDGGVRITRVDSLLPSPEDEVNHLITLYSDRFRAGDVDGVLALMDPEMRENGVGGDNLRTAYASTLPVSRYDLSVEGIDVNGDTARARGSFFIQRQENEHRGAISFDLAKRGGSWRIVNITYEEKRGFFDRPLAAYYLYPIPKLGKWWMHKFDGWDPRHTPLANVASGVTLIDAAFSGIAIGTGIAVEANPIMAATGPALPAAIAAGDMAAMKMANDAPAPARPLILLSYTGVKLGIVLASFLLVF